MNKLIRKILEYLRGEPQHLNKLIQRGLKIGKNFHRMGGVIIDPTHCYHITIGDNVVLAPRVHILAHDASTGIFIGKTRAAKGEYVCFVDSDDYWQHNVLAGLMEQIERDNLDVLRFRLQYVNPEGEVYNPYKSNPFKGMDYSDVPTDGVSFLNSRMNTRCYAWQFVLKRELLDGCIFTPGIYFEDTDWTPRMLCKAKRVASTETVVYNYLVREGSITNAVNRSKQKKVLDDKMRLIVELQRQAEELKEQGEDNRWFAKMIAATVISIVGILSTQFYEERKDYLSQLKEFKIFPIQSHSLKARLINFSPRLAVELLHWKNGVR